MQNANVSISGDISYERPIVPLDFIFEETSSNTGEVIDYIGTDRNIVIPSSYSIAIVDGEEVFIEGDDYTVTAIADGLLDTGVFYGDNITSVVFPDTLERIGDFAFFNVTTLTTINLGDNLVEIGAAAFYNCSNLTGEIVFPSSLRTIVDTAFYNCSSLSGNLTFPTGLTSLGANAFYNCSSLTGNLTFPSGITSIGTGTFYNCTGLSSVVIGENVSSIGENAFANCGAESVTIPESVTSIGTYSFENMNNLSKLNFNANISTDFTTSSHIFRGSGVDSDSGINVIFGEDVTRVPAYLFYEESSDDVPNITSVTLSENITEIGDYSFYNSVFMEELYVNSTNLNDFVAVNFVFVNIGDNTDGVSVVFGEGVERVPASMFLGLVNNLNIVSVTFSSTIQEIGESAFIMCRSITSMNLGDIDDLTTIGSIAFYNCSGLTNITIPSNVSSIGEMAFANIGNLNTLNINARSISDFASDDNVFMDSGTNEGVSISVIFGEGVISVPAYLFFVSNSTSVTNPTVPNISSITFPSTIETIGRSAFRYCGASNLTIPEGAVSSRLTFEDYAFADMSNLEIININKRFSSFYSDNQNIFRNSGADTGIEVTFGERVTMLPERLFYGETTDVAPKITTVSFPSTLSQIPNYVFYNVATLESTNINELDNLTSIGSGAFENCTSLSGELLLNSVEEIYGLAFMNCSSITSVEIGPNTTMISTQAFSGCGASSLTISGNVEEISSHVFEDMSNLEIIYYNVPNLESGSSWDAFPLFENSGADSGLEVIVGEGVTQIPAYLFYGESADTAPNITSVTLPSTLQSIGAYAFYNSDSLSSITFPANMSRLGEYAFGNCTSLGNVVFEDTTGWKMINASGQETSIEGQLGNPLIAALLLQGASYSEWYK